MRFADFRATTRCLRMTEIRRFFINLRFSGASFVPWKIRHQRKEPPEPSDDPFTMIRDAKRIYSAFSVPEEDAEFCFVRFLRTRKTTTAAKAITANTAAAKYT